MAKIKGFRWQCETDQRLEQPSRVDSNTFLPEAGLDEVATDSLQKVVSNLSGRFATGDETKAV